MSEFALIEGGFVVNVVIASAEEIAEQPGEWVDITGLPGVGIGWAYDGANFTQPPSPSPVTRFVLTLAEWVDTWTSGEWCTLKKAARGDLSPTPVSENVSEKLDQLFDAIALTNSFDVQSDKANQFYQFLEDEGFIDDVRRAELQAGTTE